MRALVAEKTVRLAARRLPAPVEAAFRSNGNTLVPGSIPADTAVRLRRRALDYMQARLADAKAGRLESERAREMLAGVVYFDELGESEAGRAIVAAVIGAYVAGPGFRTVVETLGDDLIFPLRACALRVVNPANRPALVPYHQDVAFMDDAYTSLNHWITLDPCGPGRAAPSLEFVAAAIGARRAVVPPDQREYIHHMGIEIGDGTVLREFPPEIVLHPAFQPGDGILFDQYTLHRTYNPPDARKPRFSIEVRAVRAADAMADYDLKIRAAVSGNRVVLTEARRDPAPASIAG